MILPEVIRWTARFASLLAISLAFFTLLALGLVLTAMLLARFLIVNEPLVRSDAILVLASGRIERTYEAGTLYREGWAPWIILSPNDRPRARRLARQLGVNIPTFPQIQRMVLLQMGVPAQRITVLPGLPTSTQEEAELASIYARRAGISHMIVVTSPYHTRRAKSYFHAAGKETRFIIRPARFEEASPARWWNSPIDRTDVILEYLKMPKVWWSRFDHQ